MIVLVSLQLLTAPADLELARERLEFTQKVHRIAEGRELVFSGRVTSVEECVYVVTPMRPVMGAAPSSAVTTEPACGVSVAPGDEALVSVTANGAATMTAASYALEGQPSAVELERQIRALADAIRTGRVDELVSSPNPRDRIVLVEHLRRQALRSRGAARRALLQQALSVLTTLRSHAETVTEEAQLLSLKPLVESGRSDAVHERFAALWSTREEGTSESLASLLPANLPGRSSEFESGSRVQKRSKRAKRTRKRRGRRRRNR